MCEQTYQQSLQLTDSQKNEEIDSQTERKKINIQIARQIDRQIDMKIDNQKDEEKNRQKEST